jgi:hypothetical protein
MIILNSELEIPKGYTGIVLIDNQRLGTICINGKEIYRGSVGISVWWWYTDPAITVGNYSKATVVPILYGIYKDHPILGKEIMAYMLGTDND